MKNYKTLQVYVSVNDLLGGGQLTTYLSHSVPTSGQLTSSETILIFISLRTCY